MGHNCWRFDRRGPRKETLRVSKFVRGFSDFLLTIWTRLINVKIDVANQSVPAKISFCTLSIWTNQKAVRGLYNFTIG
jgi:hypothetical protein